MIYMSVAQKGDSEGSTPEEDVRLQFCFLFLFLGLISLFSNSKARYVAPLLFNTPPIPSHLLNDILLPSNRSTCIHTGSRSCNRHSLSSIYTNTLYGAFDIESQS